MSLIWFNKLLEFRNAEAGKHVWQPEALLQHSLSSHTQGPYSWPATRCFITYSDCILGYMKSNFVYWSYFLMVCMLLCGDLSPGPTGFVYLRSSHL